MTTPRLHSPTLSVLCSGNEAGHHSSLTSKHLTPLIYLLNSSISGLGFTKLWHCTTCFFATTPLFTLSILQRPHLASLSSLRYGSTMVVPLQSASPFAMYLYFGARTKSLAVHICIQYFENNLKLVVPHSTASQTAVQIRKSVLIIWVGVMDLDVQHSRPGTCSWCDSCT
jgi:hypothetical protein